MAIPLSLPYPYLCKVEINNESLKTGNMKIIDLTKESFVEKIISLIRIIGNIKGINLV